MWFPLVTYFSRSGNDGDRNMRSMTDPKSAKSLSSKLYLDLCLFWDPFNPRIQLERKAILFKFKFCFPCTGFGGGEEW